jgi:hypothetical protein
MLRFVAGTARLMERCRSAALALDRIGFPEVPNGPDGPGDPMDGTIVNGLSWKTINARDMERRRLLHWLAQGKKLAELPKVADWGEYHDPDMPDLEELDERLYPSMPQASCGSAAGHPAAPGLKRGYLKNGNPSGDFLAAPRCGAAPGQALPAASPRCPMPPLLPWRQEHRSAHRRRPARRRPPVSPTASAPPKSSTSARRRKIGRNLQA